MWDCEHCGCQAIAGTITACPMCGTPRETDVPAESLVSDASTPASAAAGAPRDAAGALSEGSKGRNVSNDSGEGNEPNDSEDGDWGSADGKDH